MFAFGLLAAITLSSPVQPVAAAACDARERALILAPALGPDDAARLSCSLKLGPGDVVTRRLVVEGSGASGIELDCNGATIGSGTPNPASTSTIEVRSVLRQRDGTAEWDRPTDIRIRNCTVRGSIRVWGMARNGQGEALRLSSHSLGHTERAQAAAPTRITIDSSRLVGSGEIPLYVAPGVTELSLTNSEITGRSVSVGLYLDAESARNAIRGNRFDVQTGREVVAVDGSAGNTIADNSFMIGWRNGIDLYRNCGEGGTVRHQTPSHNRITDNRFRYRSPVHFSAVNVGSREGWALYCHDDDGYPFGSSADNGDHATDNVVENNTVE